MTHFENKSSDQRGALMMEAIALLGLMTMMSPMVVRQSSERITEMEDVTVAAQMKTMKDALANYMEANYATLVGNNNQESVKTASVSAAQLRPFLPASYFDGSNNLHGNKTLAGDKFKFGVRMTCSETTLKSDGTQCGTLNGGVYGGLSASCKCERYKLTGLVLGGSDNAVPDKRASRIASMIGADGGYMRTQAMNVALGEEEAGQKKVLGSQGMWEIGDVADYHITLSDAEKAVGGRIAASTVYSAGRSADYLYRKKVNGVPDANSMFTDLDMGGNGGCTDTPGEGKCNLVNNAGGVEIISGKLVIRKKNAADDKNQSEESGDARARIFVDTETAKMNLSKAVILSAGKADGALPAAPDDGTVSISAQKDVAATAVEKIALTDAKTIELKNNASNVFTMTKDGGNEKTTIHTGEEGDNASHIELTKEQLLEKGNKIAITSTSGEIAVTSKTSVATKAETGISVETTAGDITQKATAGNISETAKQSLTLSANESKYLIKLSSADEKGIFIINQEDNINIEAEKEVNVDAKTDINLAAQNDVNALAFKKMSLGAGTDSADTAPRSHLILNSPANRMDDSHDTVGYSAKKGGTLAELKGGLFVISDTSNDTTPGGLQIGTSTTSGEGHSRVYLTSNGMTIHKSTTAQPGFYTAASTLSDSAVLKNQYQNYGNKFETKVGKEDVVITSTDSHGGVIALNAKAAGTDPAGAPSIKMIGKTGVIEASRMEVTTIRDAANDSQKNAVRSMTTVSYSATGEKEGDGTTVAADAKTFSLKRGSSSFITYENHGDNDLNNLSFAVDPAFLSTMNDIRLTSRGGARLSEILPNYITKGIYELRNTYVKGPWPCDGSTGCADTNTMCAKCSHTLPINIVSDEGTIAAGYGFEGVLTCNSIDINHATNGTCSESGDNITINLKANDYTEGEGIAHPFLGVVPAPGRKIATKGSFNYSLESTKTSETMAAYDEGACPNGYTALMSVTPASFSIGGVWASYAAEVDAAGWMVTIGDAGAIQNSEEIIQGGNIMGVTNLAIKDSSTNKTVGWAVAMSTVAAGGDGDDVNYYWNYAGTVYTNTITAYVTTYCYYNPSFFNLPNMKINSKGLLTPMEHFDDTITSW